MKLFGQVVSMLLCCALIAYPQGNHFTKIRYAGGTLRTEVKPKDWDNSLTVSSDWITFALKDGQTLEIDPASVESLSYGQEAHRRVGTMIALGILVAPLALFGLFHKTRQHFVGIEFTNQEGKKSALLLQAHKDNYRAVLVALNGVTDTKVVVSEEDRKYVPTAVAMDGVSEGELDRGESAQAAPTADDSKKGIVRVVSVPENAEIWVDDVFVGSAPATIPLPSGNHHIRVRLAGHLDWSRQMMILPDAEVTLNAKLERKGNRIE